MEELKMHPDDIFHPGPLGHDIAARRTHAIMLQEMPR